MGVQKMITLNCDEPWDEGMSELFPALLMLKAKGGPYSLLYGLFETL